MGVWDIELDEVFKLKFPRFLGIKGLDNFDPNPARLTFHIINYDQIKRHRKRIEKLEFDAIVLDEAHRIKNRRSKRSKAVQLLCDLIQYVFELTGTPFDKIHDIWHLFRCLDKRIFRGSWDDFVTKHFVKSGYMGFKLRIKSSSKKFIKSMIKRNSFQITKRKALDLPPLTHQVIPIQLSPSVQKLYTKLENDYYAEMDGMVIEVDIKIALLRKLAQLCGGILSLEDKKAIVLKQDKLEALVDLMEDYGDKKIVIYCAYELEIHHIKLAFKGLGDPYRVIQGGMKPEDVTEAWTTFQNSKTVNRIIIQFGTGTEGIQLFMASIGIFYSKTFSWIEYSQAIGRIERQGQQNKMTILHLTVPNTVDSDNHMALNEKDNVVNYFLNRRKRDHGKKEKRERQVENYQRKKRQRHKQRQSSTRRSA